jgi:hypothetical protein
MKKILFALASMALVAGSGCGGSAADEVIGKLKSTKDKICACKDKACVEAAEADMMKWMMANADKFKNVKPSKAQEEAADKIDDEMDKCKEKISGGE